jgi:hypothetical protein
MIAELPSIFVHIEFANDKNRIRLHVSDDEQTYGILDAYWGEHYQSGKEFPSLGFSATTHSDVYEPTVEQLFHVLAARLGYRVAPGRNAEHRQTPPKKALTPAQREARRLNAEKARNRRLARQSV